MAESEAAKPDPRGESGNGVCSQQSNTLAQDTHLDFHVKNTFNFNLVSVNVLLGFLTLQAKQIKLKSVQLSA